MNRINLLIVQEGRDCMSNLLDASIRNSMNGLGGCKEFDYSDYPIRFHDLIEKYITGEMCSIECTYIAMKRLEVIKQNEPIAERF